MVTGGLVITAITVAMDSADDAVPVVGVEGGGVSSLFTINTVVTLPASSPST